MHQRCMHNVSTAFWSVASFPIPGGHSLHSMKNRGRSFDKVVDQNSLSIFSFPLFFTG